MSFHLYDITELYSNANGTVQFIEIFTADPGQQFLNGHEISSTDGVTTHTYAFDSDRPGDSLNTSVLIATQGFADLGLVTPDYIVPDGFLFTEGGTVNFAGVDIVTHTALPTDGTQSVSDTGVVGTASPENFAGDTGPVMGVPAGEVFTGSGAADNLAGGDGYDALSGEAGNDTLAGGSGNDSVVGGDGNDSLDGGAGDDTTVGGADDDTHVIDSAGDVVTEAAAGGIDTVKSSVSEVLSANVENLTLTGTGNINGTGNTLANIITGNGGNNVLNGVGGADTLKGMAGNDTMVWSAPDSYNGGGGNLDTLKLTSGNLNLTTVANTKILNVEQINMTGGNNNTLTLNQADVLDISSTTNVLKILGNDGDTVDLRGINWVDDGIASGFHTYHAGLAIVRIDVDINVI